MPFQVEFIRSAFWKGILAFLLEPILQYDIVDNLAAENTSPSEKFFAYTVKFFENHFSAASMTLHNKDLHFAESWGSLEQILYQT